MRYKLIDNTYVMESPIHGWGVFANKRLWNMGCEVQSIDMGSWIDPYVGVVNRTWTRHALHHMMKNQ